MTEFDEVVRAGFDARLQAISEAGGVPRKRARSVLTAIRRRRAVRAGTVTGASLLTVAAVAAGAMALRPAGVVAPVGLPTASPDAPSWCDLSTYPAVNSDALGAFPYAGRIWANATDNEYVYVTPDGVKTVLEPDADGNYYATSPAGRRLMVPGGSDAAGFWSHMIWDMGADGSDGGRAYSVGPDETPYYGEVGPALLYEWSTSAPREVPASVNQVGIMNLQLQSLGFPLSFGVDSVVPAGSRLEQVLRWTDGRERVTQVDSLHGLAPLIEGNDLDGLASASLRVTGLPDGESYEVTSTYDPTKSWAAACGTTLSVWPTAPPLPDVNWGPYFEGPESAEFQCDVAVRPEDEDVIPLTVQVGSGLFQRTFGDGGSMRVDLGTEGSLVELTVETFEVKGDPQPMPLYPGWYASWHDSGGGTMRGAVLFGARAWLDSDGRIVGREFLTAEGVEVGRGPASPDTSGAWDLVGGRTSWVIARKDAATAGVPCDGVDASALATASVVWIQGLGADADHMTWSWTRVWPEPQS